jgi:hypothetical protein
LVGDRERQRKTANTPREKNAVHLEREREKGRKTVTDGTSLAPLYRHNALASSTTVSCVSQLLIADEVGVAAPTEAQVSPFSSAASTKATGKPAQKREGPSMDCVRLKVR